MLIRFAVENWMSFREEVILSMIASSERQHSERLRPLSNYRTRILPIASVYGGNASGKSNLIKAIHFAQDFIVSGPKQSYSTRVKPFRLDKKSVNHPTRFRFEVLIDGHIYEYSFSLSSKRVMEEELKRLRVTRDDILFRRAGSKFELGDEFIAKSALQVVFEGTQDNQLFLTNSVSQKRAEFKQLFDWFDSTLTVIFPQSYFGGLPYITSRQNAVFEKIISLLNGLDSGIANLQQVSIPIERVPNNIIAEVEDDPEGQVTGYELAGDGLVFVFKRRGKVIAKKLITVHKSKHGEKANFNLDEESDGTRRLLDLLPAFVALEHSRRDRVFIIDEFDRSLHSLLAKKMLERYLAQLKDKFNSQLIFTTHNVQLMDQEILRRDEIWIVEREESGASALASFSDFKDVRNDKDIRKSYLQGRMGGVPRLTNKLSLVEAHR